MKVGYKIEHNYYGSRKPSGVMVFNYQALNELVHHVISYKLTDVEKIARRKTHFSGIWNVTKLK